MPLVSVSSLLLLSFLVSFISFTSLFFLSMRLFVEFRRNGLVYHALFVAVMLCATQSVFASSPTWKRFGALQQARHAFAAYPISSARAIVIGGYTGAVGGAYSGSPTANCEIIDADTRTISVGPPMNVARAEFASVQMPDGTIVVVSGVSIAGGGLTNTVEVYNPNTRIWRRIGTVQIARRQHVACVLSADEVLVVGGRLANLNSVAASEIVNIRTGESRRVADFPYPINSGAAVQSSEGKPLVFGGRSGGGDSYRTSAIYEYDKVSNRWNMYGNMSAAVQSIVALRHSSGRFIVSGGTSRESSTPFIGNRSVSIESERGVSVIASMQIDRVWHSMVEWNADSLLTIGGLNNMNTPTSSVDWINLRNGQSTAAPSMLREHSHAQAVSLSSRDANGQLQPRVLMISGFSAGYRETASIEILDRTVDSIIVPTITSFTPTRGTNGTVMIITGTGLTGVTSVTIGGVPAVSFRVDAPTQITAQIGSGASGSVRVSNSRGTAERSGFVFAAPMQVTTIARGLGRGVYHIAQDKEKNLYIPAQDQGRIYRITPSGQVSTFFSQPTGPCGFIGGIAIDKDGFIYASYSCTEGIIYKIHPNGREFSIFYRNPSVGSIYGMEFDSDGSLWAVCDKDNIGSAIKITNGITTILYRGTMISNGFAIKLDGRGNAYIPSYINQHIVKINACGSIEVVYNGNRISYPQGIVIGESGNLYIASNFPDNARLGNTITKLTPLGEASIFAGTGVAGSRDGSLGEASFNGPTGMFFNEVGDLYISDYFSGSVRKISNVGELPLNTNVPLYSGPQLSDFSPRFGTSGTVITIRGINLGCVRSVNIGGVQAASFTILSDNEIRAVVGGGATGAIQLISPNGNVSKELFTFLVPPIITAVNPSALQPGATVVITGRNFLGATSVRFGSIEASIFTINSDSRITAVIPQTLGSSATVRVQTPAGTAQFTTVSRALSPIITSVSDSVAGMGDTVIIRGRNFLGTTEVRFGSTTNSVRAISFSVISDSIVIAVIATGATGSVFATTPFGTAEWNGFRFRESISTPIIEQPRLIFPHILTFSPIQAGAGAVVHIVGSGFTGTRSVIFGTSTNATLAASFTVRNDSLIVATLGTGASGNITVITTTGTALRAGFLYLGQTIPTPPTMLPTSPTVTLPRPDTLRVMPPTITALAPSCIAGGNLLTITGTGFIGRPEVRVGRFTSGNTPQALVLANAIVVVSTTQILVTLPGSLSRFTGLQSGSREFGVSVSTTTGTATRSGLQYIETPPAITAFSPSSAIRGEKISIVGQGFTCANDVRVGGIAVENYQVVSDSLIIATINVTTSGTVRVATPAGIAERGGFVYATSPLMLLPTITSFAPNAARVGQTVTITGTNFSGATPTGAPFTTTLVSLGGVALPFTVVSPTQITVRIPADFVPTNTDVRVMTPGGSVSAQGFTFIPEPIITSFGPQSASTGSVVLISGRNFTGTNSVQFGNAPAQSFTVLSDTLISAVVGDGASGDVRVTTQNGSATRSGFTFVIPPPFITSFTPTLFAPSTTITISGRNFVGNGYTTQLVLIGNNAAMIISVNPTTLVVRAPAIIQTTTITVITPGGTANACCLQAPQMMLPPIPQPPRISGFSPALAGVGAVVTIRGENFTGATDVRFGGVTAASFRVISSTEILATVGAGQTGDVSVRTPIGIASFAGFTFVTPPQPIITGFSPATGAAGDTVRVRGQHLQTVSSFTITGDPNITVNAAFTTSGDTLVTAVLGVGQSFSLGTINLRTLGGTARATGFTFIAAPVITSFSPTIAGNGDAVVINGAGFDNLQSVAFGNPPNLVQVASFVVNSPSRITARLSTGATGSVVVTTRGGTASREGFIFAPVPVITRFVPDSARAGETVRILGSGFITQSAVSVVNFGGIRAQSWTVVSDSVITAVPAQTGATGAISLTTPGGTASRNGFVFLAPLPTITSFTPQQASVGDIVTIVGTNLNGATSVSFGSRAAASFLVSSPTQIVARVGNGTSGTITVQTPGGRATATNFVFIPAPPVITSFSPDSAASGRTITLRGRDFSGVTAVRFIANGTTVAAQSYSISNDSTMTARVPALGTSRITASVTVQSPNGTGSREGLQFVPAPTISGFTPSSATVGTAVVITGTNLSGVTAVRFGGTNARSFTVNSPTQITAIVGSGASGTVSVVSYGGTGTRDGFTFQAEQVVIPAPAITSFSPQEAAQNATVTITGTNFTGSGLSGITNVLFGGVPAQSYAIQSPTTITAVVGAGASGAITVTSARGNASVNGFRFIPAPVITDFTPKSGGRGTAISILGRNFTGASSVSFGGTAVQFTVSGDTLIRATVQIGSTGAVSVTTPGGTATAQGFTFLPSVFAANNPKDNAVLTSVHLQSSVNTALRIYPNPTQEILTIEASAECLSVQPQRCVLRNSIGAVVMTFDATTALGSAFRKELNVGALPTGAYSVEMLCGTGERFVARFVKF